MQLEQAKMQFINNWGSLGSHWGISKTMAQVYALLLVSADPITQDDVMKTLDMSRGSVNTNIRELIGWGIVDRVVITGERKEYFIAEKDIWKASAQIIKERKKRELDPMIKLLRQLEDVEGDKKDKHIKQFTTMMKDIRKMGSGASKMLDLVTDTKANWFLETVSKIFK
jgi:DNA-binding transcriptional regulator GbsR (MarR family)